MGNLLGTAAESEIKFHLRIELEKNATTDTISKLNEVLQQFGKQLTLGKQ